MTTEKLTLNIRESDQYVTEKASLDAERSDTVLEKLKELEGKFVALGGFVDLKPGHSLTDHEFKQRLERFYALERELHTSLILFRPAIPRLIAALELVEAKAKEVTSYDVWGGVPQEPKVDFAREVLAVVNGETKGVVANAMIRCGLDPAAAPLNNADLVAMSGQRFADDVEEPK